MYLQANRQRHTVRVFYAGFIGEWFKVLKIYYAYRTLTPQGICTTLGRSGAKPPSRHSVDLRDLQQHKNSREVRCTANLLGGGWRWDGNVPYPSNTDYDKFPHNSWPHTHTIHLVKTKQQHKTRIAHPSISEWDMKFSQLGKSRRRLARKKKTWWRRNGP